MYLQFDIGGDCLRTAIERNFGLRFPETRGSWTQKREDVERPLRVQILLQRAQRLLRVLFALGKIGGPAAVVHQCFGLPVEFCSPVGKFGQIPSSRGSSGHFLYSFKKSLALQQLTGFGQ